MNDTCPGAIPIVANTSYSGTTLSANPDYDDANAFSGGNCSNGDKLPGVDVVYSFTATTTGPLTVNVSPVRNFDVGVAVMAGNSNAGSCVDTRDIGFESDPEDLTFQATAGTTYYFVVDSYYNLNPVVAAYARGGFILSVR